MINIKKNLIILLLIVGCAGSLGSGGGSSGLSYALKFRLKENDKTYTNFNDNLFPIFNQNIEVKLEDDEFDLYSEKEGKIAGKVLIVKSNDKLKISKKDVTNEFIKEYAIKIDKKDIIDNGKLKETVYLPILIGEKNNEVVELKENSNSLSDPFKSNILKLYFKNDKQEILGRFKTFYYIDTNSQQFPSKSLSKKLEVSLDNLAVIANNRGKDIGILLYGLEQFEEEGENKNNLVALGDELITKVDLPYITLISENGKQTLLEDSQIDIIPNSFKVGGFQGKIQIVYKDIENNNVGEPLEYVANTTDLIKYFDLKTAVTKAVDKIIFKFIYDENVQQNSYMIAIKVPSSEVILKYRVKEQDKYIPLLFSNNILNIDQNLQILLEDKQYQLYIKDNLQSSNEVIIKDESNVKIKDNGGNTLKNYTIKVDKSKLIVKEASGLYALANPTYLPITLDILENELVEKKDLLNSLPAQNFKSNILKIFFKDNSSNVLDRFKSFYYAASPNAPSAATSYTSLLSSGKIEDVIATNDNIGKNLILRLYGLEHFEYLESKNMDLVALGDSLATTISLPYITLTDGNNKKTISSNSVIDFKPIFFKIGGFKGNIIVKYEDVLNSVITQKSYDASSKDNLIKTYNLDQISDSIKQIRFTIVYEDSSNNSYDIVVNIPYEIKIKYRLIENGNYEKIALVNDSVTYSQNVEIILDEDNFDLYLSNVKQENKRVVLTAAFTSTSKFQIKPKNINNTTIKEFTINIDKTLAVKTDVFGGKILKEQVYAPVLLKVDNNDIVELKDSTNILPDPFKSNILKGFFINDKLTLLKNRFKEFYYVVAEKGTAYVRLSDKKFAQKLEVSVDDIENFISVAYNKSRGLGINLYGLEYFDNVGKDNTNLVSLESSMLVSVGLPYITLIGGALKKVVLNDNATLYFKPSSFKIGGFRGNITVKYEKGSQVINQQDYNALTNNLIKSYELTSFPNSTIDKIRFRLAYEETTSASHIYDIIVNIPYYLPSLNYRLQEGANYIPLTFVNNELNLDQNIQISLDVNDYDLYVKGVKQQSRDAIIKDSSLIEIKYGTILVSSYKINIDKSNFIDSNKDLKESIYSSLKIAITNNIISEDLSYEVLPNPFKSNILKLFIKNEKQDILKRFKSFYYVNSKDFSDKKYSLLTDINSLNNLSSIANDKGKDLFLKLYGLEQFEEEGLEKINLVGLGESLRTISDLPYVGLTNSTNAAVISGTLGSINFKPTSFSIAGFRGTLTVSYIDSGAKVLWTLTFDYNNDSLIKTWSLIAPDTKTKTILFQLKYPNNAIYTININLL